MQTNWRGAVSNPLLRQVVGVVHRHSRALSMLVIVSMFAVMGWRLALDWRNLPPDFLARVNPVLLLVSVVALMPPMVLVSTRWWLTLRLIGVKVGWRSTVRVWFLSQAGRYLPGGVWPYVGRFVMSRGEVEEGLLVTGMVMETALRVVSEICVFLATLPFWLGSGFLDSRYVVLLVGAAGLGLIALHPAVLGRYSSLPIVRRIWSRPVDVSHLEYGRVLLLAGYYALTVVAVGAAFYIMVIALYPLSVDMLPPLCGALALAVVLGFLTPLVPNGWGVREGVLALLLGQMMSPAVAILVAAMARVWLTLGEAACILAALVDRRAARRPDDDPRPPS